jgi:ribose 5-phosphate isomerase B
MKKIYIASDHGGFELKEKLIESMKELIDLGPKKYNKNDDFPDYAKKLAKKIKKDDKGILICGTGQGMSIVANKIKNIRAALCFNEYTAKCAKEHLNANIITIGARTTSLNTAKKIIKTWLKTKFSKNKKYQRRLNKI